MTYLPFFHIFRRLVERLLSRYLAMIGIKHSLQSIQGLK